jgi:hypothetical protein
MTSEAFLRQRCLDLQDFFRATFGRWWRAELRRRGVPPNVLCLRPEPRVGLNSSLPDIERFAAELGFRIADDWADLTPHERNPWYFLRVLINTSEKGVGSVTAFKRFDWQTAIFALQHRVRGIRRRSDVIPEHLYRLHYQEQGTASPLLGKNPPNLASTTVEPTLAQLLAEPVSEPEAPNAAGPVPPGEGGGAGGASSLSGSRKISDPSRLKTPPRWDPYKDGIVRWRNEVTRLITDLRKSKVARPAKERLLSEAVRLMEGLLMRWEFDQKLADGKDIP